MYKTGTKFEVKTRIKMGETIIEPGTKGEIIEGISKIVAKAYKVKLEDGRTPQLHIVIMNNHTKTIKEE